jgi:hypothetical protein
MLASNKYIQKLKLPVGMPMNPLQIRLAIINTSADPSSKPAEMLTKTRITFFICFAFSEQHLKKKNLMIVWKLKFEIFN